MSPETPGSDRPLRVGIITDGLKEGVRPDGSPRIANGGVGVYIYNLVKHLQQLEDGPELVLMRCGRGELDIYEGPRTTSVFVPSTRFNRLARWLDWPYRRVVREHGINVVHHPNQFGGIMLPKSVRQVATLHDISPLLMPQHHRRRTVRRYRYLMHRSLRQVDRIITDSHHTKRDVLERNLAPDDKVTVIPLGVAESYRPGVRTDDFRSRYDVPDRFILSVGVLEPRKNHKQLVEALHALHAKGDKVGLVIVGRPGWNWTDPRTLPEASELANWIRVYQDVPEADLAEFYCRSAVLAYPSHYEGFGLPVIEAMASATPVVASRVSSLPGVCNGAAVFHEPNDVSDLTTKLHRVLTDQALRERLIAEGPLHASEFSWYRTVRATLDVYRRVCGVGSTESASTASAPAPPSLPIAAPRA